MSATAQSNGTATGGAAEASNSGQLLASVVPRDVRLLHLIFATQGIQNYEDHVPLQLMDFAHSKLP